LDSAYGFLGEGILILAIAVPVAALWAFALMDLIRRRDLAGWQTALWMLVIVFLPVIGFLVYFVFRPDHQRTPRKPQPSDFYSKFHLDTRRRK